MKKILAAALSLTMVFSVSSCGGTDSSSDNSVNYSSLNVAEYSKLTAAEIVSKLTLEQKAAQMVQAAVYSVSEEQMRENDYGSILSKYDTIDAKSWRELVD